MFTLKKNNGKARLGEFKTVHGTINTPAFMNVATCGAIKGGLSSYDLMNIKCQVQLSNTYHLHLRPGDEVIKSLGGIRKFTGFNGPTLTDSGGFQIFSLASLRKISEEGVEFASHIDGRKIFMRPEDSMKIQSNLGSTIAMAFDECIENPAEYSYVKESSQRTYRWLSRCKKEMKNLNRCDDTINMNQMLFGINQGGVYKDIRIEHMEKIAELDLDGYAIGGLSVGETEEEMYEVIDTVEPFMPKNKIRYLMGVGKPHNILEAVKRGVDLFDCVMPSRNARHGQVFTFNGYMNLLNEKYKLDSNPIEEGCGCPTCEHHSRAYLRHLIKANEVLGLRLCVMHNLYFYNTLLEKIREALLKDEFDKFYKENIELLKIKV